MDRAVPSTGDVLPGVSIRNGPVQEIDTHMADANGVEANGGPVKRKVRESLTRPSYVDAETSGEDDKPLVWTTATNFSFSIISG
jgi:DNA topoisomerase-1